MRIVHFVRVAPHRSGLYETTRELAKAAIMQGHDAALVCIHDRGKRAGTDRGVPIIRYSDVTCDEDVFILHSMIPEPFYSSGVPIVLALHGQPKYCMVSEDAFPNEAPLSTLLAYFNSPQVKGSVTMWEKHKFFWEQLSQNKPVEYVPAPVDTSVYKPDGPKHTFNGGGEYNVVFCDSWRWMKLPFNILAAFRILWNYYNRKDIKLSLYAMPSGDRGKFWNRFIERLVQPGENGSNQFVAELDNIIKDLPSVFRGADLLITPEEDESRVVREAVACGCPVLAPAGATLGTYGVNFENPMGIADALMEIFRRKVPAKVDYNRIDKERGLKTVGQRWLEAIERIVGVPCLS